MLRALLLLMAFSTLSLAAQDSEVSAEGFLRPSEALANLLMAHPELVDAFNPSVMQLARSRPAVMARSCGDLRLCEAAAEPVAEEPAAEEAAAEGEEAAPEKEGGNPTWNGYNPWAIAKGDPGWMGVDKKMDVFKDMWKKPDSEIPQIEVGDTVKVTTKLGEKTKKGRDRTGKYEGIVIAIRRKRQWDATITVRRIIKGFGVEKIWPLHSPNVVKIEVLKHAYVRRKKLYYLRNLAGKKARLKQRFTDEPGMR